MISTPPSDTPRPAVRVYAAAAGSVLIWGATAVVTKLAVGRMDPLLAGVLRTVLGMPVAAALIAVWGLPRPRTPREVMLLGVSALGGFVLFPLLFSLGIEYSTASHAGLVLAGLPVFTGLLAAAVERAWPRSRWWFGVAIALVGEALLIGLRFGFRAGEGSVLGDVVLLAAVVAAAMGYVAGGRLGLVLGTWATTAWGIVVGGVLLLPLLAVLAPATDWAALGGGGWSAVAYLALFSNLLAYALWYRALGRGGIARVALLQFVQPVVTLLLSVWVLGEVLTVPLLAAAAVILAGIAIARRR